MSPAGRALRKFPHNTPLESVGGIYVRKLLGRKPQAVIDVKFVHHPVATVPIEVVGELVPGSCFRDKKRIPASGNIKRKIVVKGIGDAYADNMGTYWHQIDVADGEPVVVRSLELARVLFFHSPHIVRSALRPNGLNALARVVDERKNISILFSELSDFPASQLSNKRIRSHLAWLLLSESAGKSFGSILQQWQQGTESKWGFHFCPPAMEGWSLNISCLADEKKNPTGEVSEIYAVDVSDFWVGKAVLFDHPKLKKRVELDRPDPAHRTRPPVDDQPDLDIPSTPGYGRPLHSMDDANLTFSLPMGLITDVVDGRPSPMGNGDADEDFEPQSTGAGSADGEGESREFHLRLGQGKDDQDDMVDKLEEKPIERFPNFQKVIHRLVSKHEYKLQSELKSYAFPEPNTRSSVILRTKEKTPISFCMAVLECAKTTVCIMEIDVESLITPPEKKAPTIGNLLFVPSTDITFNTVRIAQSISDTGVKWKYSELHENTKAYEICSHPHRYRTVTKKKNEVSVTSEGNPLVRERRPVPEKEFIDAWVKTLNDKIGVLLAKC
jgi:hypothetical protein